MNYTRRRPEFEVTVWRANYSAAGAPLTLIVTFTSKKANNDPTKSNALVAYKYTESLYNVDGPFDLQLVPEEDKDQRTWIDKIDRRDIVTISEFGTIRYVGVVSTARYSARMSDGKPQRAISIAGKGIGGLLASIPLIMDQRVWAGNVTVETASKAFMAELAAKYDVSKSLQPAITGIYRAYIKFLRTMGQAAGATTLGLEQLFNTYLDYTSQISLALKTLYPIALSVFQVGENNIWDVWKSLAQPPLHELFGRWNASSNKYEIVFRQTPFDAADWAALPLNAIDTTNLVDYDVGVTDEEVKTFFMGVLTGAGITQEKATAVSYYANSRIVDAAKWPMYGYRPMVLEFKYFNRDLAATFGGVPQVMASMSKRLQTWFSKSDEFYSGSVNFMTTSDVFPRIGERLAFLGGQFYIEQAERSWQYGGAMSTRLTISRGYIYSRSGALDKKISNMGRRLKEAETAAASMSFTESLGNREG